MVQQGRDLVGGATGLVQRERPGLDETLQESFGTERAGVVAASLYLILGHQSPAHERMGQPFLIDLGGGEFGPGRRNRLCFGTGC